MGLFKLQYCRRPLLFSLFLVGAWRGKRRRVYDATKPCGHHVKLSRLPIAYWMLHCQH
ncbi:hypothetical protein BDV12DRAFT_1013 [Aspergillus spectabilis]